MFPSLVEEITGQGMPIECSKLTCFAKVKIRHGSRVVRSTIEVGRCQSSFAYCEGERSIWEREKIGGRRRIHTEKTKTITTRIRIHTSTSRRVKVKSTFGGPSCMRRSRASVHGMLCHGTRSADLLAV